MNNRQNGCFVAHGARIGGGLALLAGPAAGQSLTVMLGSPKKGRQTAKLDGTTGHGRFIETPFYGSADPTQKMHLQVLRTTHGSVDQLIKNQDADCPTHQGQLLKNQDAVCPTAHREKGE